MSQSCGLSSRYSFNATGCNPCITGNCSAAINGNNDTTFNNTANPPNCIHTAATDSAPFWWVDLGQNLAISSITIFGRKDYLSRMMCVNVSVDGQLVKSFANISGWIGERFDIPVRDKGQVINITKACSTPSNDGPTINICEVQVWVCDDGWYGDCTHTCGHCAGRSTCDKVNGNCTSCDTGFQPPLCQDCKDGHFSVSSNCQNTCGGGCNNTCNKTDGTCQCRADWEPPLCQRCTVGLWGDSCSRACGDGCENRTCDTVDGTCTCMNGWITPRCEVNNTYLDGKLGQSPGTLGGAIAGPVLAVIAAAVVVVIVILVVRRRRQQKGPHSKLKTRTTNRSENVRASEISTNVKPSQGVILIAEVKPQKVSKTGKYDVSDFHVYRNTSKDPQSGQESVSADHANEIAPASETIQSVSSNNGKSEGNSRPITMLAQEPGKKGPVDAKVYENVDLKADVSSISDARRSKGSPAKPSEDMVEVVVENFADDDSDGMHNTDDVYASYRSLGPSSLLDDFQKRLLASLASGKLEMEFAEFSKRMEHPHEIGSKPENSNNNRFKALFAYDHSRVVLRRPKGDNNTDYINANYTKGCHREKAYIATQGPRVNTVDDLWWMVWQENSTQIVMLTNIKECGKDKCEEYWPSVGETRTFGHVAVTALNTDTRAHFVVRYFLLSAQKGGEQREVSQFHYLAWPDHGVPSSFSLVNFWRYVKSRATGAIPIVHCSAGVGRTGTYIGLDIAFDLRSSGRDVNVKDIVTRLRQDRTLMVQTEEQYTFLHEVILEEYTSRASRMTFEQFDAVFPDTITGHTARIEKEFEILKQMGDFVPKPNHTIAGSNENIPKNRSTESLPVDSSLVYLTEYIPGRNQYINAIQMSSFRKPNGLILTQLPLPDTVVDIWRLVHGCDVNTIVSIGHKEQRTSIKNYCAYWPETEKDVLITGPYVISLRSKSALGNHVTCYNLSLTKKASNSREIRVMYYDDWKGVVPGSISDILQLTDILESWHVENDSSPIIVQCSDGIERSGMFCVMYDVINHVRHDQEIDVYIPVRQVQSVRQQAVTTEMQYSYCYKVAQECKRQQSVYQNT